jgi:transcriptional regulator of arginine metabolism
MHMMIASKTQRRQRIRELLTGTQVFSQEQLQELLRAHGTDATQATLSRDLRELGVWKGPDGYRLPSEVASGGGAVVIESLPHRNGTRPHLRELARTLPGVLLSAEVGGNLVVLHTQPAHANPLAIEIDRAQLPDVLGTIAGDDTVFVATRGSTQARRLLRTIRELAGVSLSRNSRN